MTHWRQRGVSLVEALVAMAVMAFGMLAVVGLQVTLRTNGDVSKQRAEAVRIAQQSIEDWRAFTAVEVTAGVVDYQDLVSDGPVDVAGINATYARTRTVTVWPATWPGGSSPMKTLAVAVTWDDRKGQPQSVLLNSVIAGVAPELAGSLALPANGVAGRQPLGRHRTIPVLAKDLGSVSGFMPPQAAGGEVAWIFNNITGLIVGICQNAGVASTALLTVAIANSCVATNAQLLTGYVSFTSGGALPPNGLPLPLDLSLNGITSTAGAVTWSCFDDSQTIFAAAVPGSAVTYYCAIVSSNLKWSGRSRITPIGGWSILDNVAGNYKVCRYTPVTGCDPAVDSMIWGRSGAVATCAAPNPQTIPPTPSRLMANADHPLDYATVSGSLTNQNFLVISSLDTCPAAAVGGSVTFNTSVHQDGVGYSN